MGRHPRWQRRVVALAAIAVVIGMAASSCGSNVDEAATGSGGPPSNLVTSSDPPKLGGTLVYALAAESNGWNTSFNQWGPSGLTVARALFDTMGTFDENGSVKPFLLDSFSSSDNFQTWTLKLRPGITLHNGKPVTATTIVRNQMFLKNSAQAGVLYKVIESFEAVDDLTVRVRTSQPDTVFPMLLGSQLGVVVDPDWLESGDSLNPIGTGPFVLESWLIGRKLVAKKNPNYWRKDAQGRALPYLDGVEFPIITDTDRMSTALRAGDVDVIQSTNTEQYDQFRSEANDYQVYEVARPQQPESAIALNTSKPPFDDLDAGRLPLRLQQRRQSTGEGVGRGQDREREAAVRLLDLRGQALGLLEVEPGEADVGGEGRVARERSEGLLILGHGHEAEQLLAVGRQRQRPSGIEVVERWLRGVERDR